MGSHRHADIEEELDRRSVCGVAAFVLNGGGEEGVAVRTERSGSVGEASDAEVLLALGADRHDEDIGDLGEPLERCAGIGIERPPNATRTAALTPSASLNCVSGDGTQ